MELFTTYGFETVTMIVTSLPHEKLTFVPNYEYRIWDSIVSTHSFYEILVCYFLNSKPRAIILSAKFGLSFLVNKLLLHSFFLLNMRVTLVVAPLLMF